MPELPEAEYMVRRLREYAPQAFISRSRVLRPGYATLRGVRGEIRGYSRRAKNVLIHLAGERTLRIQLGMTGHVYWIADAQRPPQHTRVLFELAGGGALVFQDSRTFGSVEVHRTCALSEVFAAYGPEPLDSAFTAEVLREAAGRSRGPVKPFLLDQSKVAGLGNIWAAESLFRARISPYRPVSAISAAEWTALTKAIRQTLSRAIENTFKVTRRPEEFPDADLLWLNVYGREGKPCRRCRTPITRLVQAARATYHCPNCQRAAG